MAKTSHILSYAAVAVAALFIAGCPSSRRITVDGYDDAMLNNQKIYVLLPDTSCEAARELAERLRLSLRRADVSLPTQLTASFSVTQMQPGEDLMVMMRRLDDALYRAKRQRDCIVVC